MEVGGHSACPATQCCVTVAVASTPGPLYLARGGPRQAACSLQVLISGKHRLSFVPAETSGHGQVKASTAETSLWAMVSGIRGHNPSPTEQVGPSDHWGWNSHSGPALF